MVIIGSAPAACLPMKHILLSIALTAFVLVAAVAQDFPPDVHKFFESNCIKCHGPKKQKGSIRLDDLPSKIGDAAGAQRWQDVLDVLNLSEMPPEDEKQPSRDSLEKFKAGQTIPQIAKAREMATGTIASHLAAAIANGDITPDPHLFFSAEEEQRIEAAVSEADEGLAKLGSIHATLNGEIRYEILKLYAAFKSIEAPA